MFLVGVCACARPATRPTPNVDVQPAARSPQGGVEPPARSATSNAPSVEVRARNDGSGAFALVAQRDVDLASQVSVENLRDGKFSPIPTAIDLFLVEHCEARARVPPCVHLAQGQTFTPVPWTGYSCSGQCNQACDKNLQFAPGDFRFVVRSCDGSARYESPTFRLGPLPL